MTKFSEGYLVIESLKIIKSYPLGLESKELLQNPKHPYTDGLLSSLPGRKATAFRAPLPSIAGMVPDLRARPNGCQFNPRCEFADDKCKTTLPSLEHDSSRTLRCFHPVGASV